MLDNIEMKLGYVIYTRKSVGGFEFIQNFTFV